jgi:hypothetical protein
MSATHGAVLTNRDDITRDDTFVPGHSSDDDATTGCLLALFGALVLIGLRLLRRFGTDATAQRVRIASIWLQPARAPPAPLYLSLCVFRL